MTAPDRTLRHTTPSDGYAFFSGHAENNHNHPAIYAYGYGPGQTLVVTGRGICTSFSMADFDAAMAHYKELLEKCGYTPGRQEEP